MKIGILGSGIVGQTLGSGLITKGHQVMVGSGNPDKLKEWRMENGSSAKIGKFDEAAAYAELIILATRWSGTHQIIQQAGLSNFVDKVLIDVTNPLDFSKGAPPNLLSAPDNPGGYQVQQWVPRARVVKAFNAVAAAIMIQPLRKEGQADMLIAGNNMNAKQVVTDLAEVFGWRVHDMGPISESYWLEALAMVWIRFGFRHDRWDHAFALLL